MCTEQKVTVRVPESEGRRSRPRTTSRTTPHAPLLVESSLKAKTVGSGSKVSLFEDRSLEKTEWQEQGARAAAWKLAKNVLKLREHKRATFFSPSVAWIKS